MGSSMTYCQRWSTKPNANAMPALIERRVSCANWASEKEWRTRWDGHLLGEQREMTDPIDHNKLGRYQPNTEQQWLLTLHSVVTSGWDPAANSACIWWTICRLLSNIMTSLFYGEKYVAVDQQRSFGRCGGNHSAYYIILWRGFITFTVIMSMIRW